MVFIVREAPRIILMVAALLIRAAQGSPHLTPYIGASLPKHTISSEMLDAPSLCFCKVRCFVKETCNAVTISMERPGTTDCFFSETKQGEEVLESTTAAISFLKPRPAEPSPVNVSTSTSNTEAGSTSTDSTQGSKTPIPTSTGNISTTSGSTAQSHSVSTTTTTTISSITTTSSNTKYSNIAQTTTTTTRLDTCDTPFSLIQNVGCLLIVRNDTSWYAAEDYCTARGLQLFVAESTIVFDKLAQYLEANEEASDIWVGVRNNTWTNVRQVEEKEWQSREPNEDDFQNACARMHKKFQFKLADLPCSTEFFFICHKI